MASSGLQSFFIFRASSTLAEPLFEVMDTLPCFATFVKQDNIIDTAVDMFMVEEPSPPVPQVSDTLPKSIAIALSLIAFAKPAISSAVNPFV